MNPHRALALLVVSTAVGCASTAADDGGSASGPVTGIGTQGPATTTDAATDADTTDDGTEGGGTTAADTTGEPPETTGASDCTFCDGPNEACVDDVCVTTCHGQQPDPCGPAQVCDVMSGQCRDPGEACTLAGPYVQCGAASCGPGTVCDDQGACVPVAPCGDVACLDDGACWGTACQCERQASCAMPPNADNLNGPFSVEIGGLEFADDCTAWMVTLRSGSDFVRRMAVDGTLTEWIGVSNLNMGEIKVLKAVAPPPGISAGDPTSLGPAQPSAGAADEFGRRPSAGAEGIGEVAITYTCCPSCGCFVDPPQGVARLVEDDPNPLPIIIEAVATQGTGPFGNTAADAGPQGLTWGVDRVLYVGNSTANGDVNSADLDTEVQGQLTALPSRLTAGTPISPVHNLFATEGGTVYLFNVETNATTVVVELGSDVTALSHDAFSGIVYASLRNLDVVAIRPFTGEVEAFNVMPALGRVAVSPDGQLWYTPLGFIVPGQPIFAWDIPDTL